MKHTISKVDDGYKLRKWFLRNYPTLPIALLAKLIRSRKIAVNGERVTLNSVLLENNILSMPDEFEVERQRVKTTPISPKHEQLLKACIIYEDDDILAFNKPNNLSVQKESKNKQSMIDIINKIWPQARIVHRLDKETTGTIVFAKTRNCAQSLSNQFAENTVYKEYIAIVYNHLALKNKTIDIPLKKLCEQTAQTSLKPAQTSFEVVERGTFKKIKLTMLKSKPKHGRKHQVRIHCALGLKAPVVGDKKYGPYNSALARLPLMLHCHKIIVKVGSEDKLFISPIPQHMLDLIEELKMR